LASIQAPLPALSAWSVIQLKVSFCDRNSRDVAMRFESMDFPPPGRSDEQQRVISSNRDFNGAF